MKEFITLLLRLVPPYRKSVALNVLNNLLSTFFSLFSFALIIPILEILFGINKKTYDTLIPIEGLDNLGSALKTNLSGSGHAGGGGGWCHYSCSWG
jgi:hypothetical protein